jgi:hypothetical protein
MEAEYTGGDDPEVRNISGQCECIGDQGSTYGRRKLKIMTTSTFVFKGI